MLNVVYQFVTQQDLNQGVTIVLKVYFVHNILVLIIMHYLGGTTGT